MGSEMCIRDRVNTDVGRDSVTEPIQTVSVSSPSLRYSYAPSDRQRIACNWKLADCYETATVLCRQSDISVSIIKFTSISVWQMQKILNRNNSLDLYACMEKALVVRFFIRYQIGQISKRVTAPELGYILLYTFAYTLSLIHI